MRPITPPLYLTILRKGDITIVDLAEVGSLIPRSETQVSSDFLQDLSAEIARIARPDYNHRGRQNVADAASSRPSGAAVRDLQRIGGLIFSHLLTEPVRKRLRASAPCDLYLRLDEQLVHLPWELCYNGQDFLAAKFRVGRQVITGSPLPQISVERRQGNPLRVLLIADPTESLPEASVEAEQLCKLLDQIPGVEATLLGGRDIRKVPLQAELQTHDVVHFAGHSFYDPRNPSQSGWRLHEGMLTASELSKLTHPPLLVFSNSCQAGTTTAWQQGYRYEGQAFGIGNAFLFAGVRNYIGTFWVVHDEESLVFATAFYRSFTAGQSLGAALQQARQEIIRQRGWDSLTWASYMLYGNPAFMLLPTAEALPQLSTQTDLTSGEKDPEAPPSDPQRKVWWASSWSQLWLRRSFLLSLTFAVLLAVAYWLTTWTLKPSSFLQEYERGFQHLRAGQLEPAGLAFQRAATEPENSLGFGYDGLAAIAFEEGNLLQAKEMIGKSLAANPANVIALTIRGDISFALGEKEEALLAYTQATKAPTPWGWQKAQAYNALGVYYAREGMTAEAKSCFTAALSSGETSFESYSNLGYLAWQRGDQKEAESFFAQALRLKPHDELSRTFIEMFSASESASPPQAAERKILIIPFVLEGGTVRRLGEGEVLAWKLAQHLTPTLQPVIANPDVLRKWQYGKVETTPAVLKAWAKEKGSIALVWGELQSFSAKLIAHGQVVEVKAGAMKRVDLTQAGGTDRLTTTAQRLAEQVAAIIDQKRR